MSNRHRYLRTLALFVLMILYSVSIMGHTDERLNIGGFDYDFDMYVQDTEIDESTDLLATRVDRLVVSGTIIASDPLDEFKSDASES